MKSKCEILLENFWKKKAEIEKSIKNLEKDKDKLIKDFLQSYKLLKQQEGE